ncbi:GtrA family protein [Granulicoccus phenolivorans]|uniref:GtrA family protein n=1 Tax=Granulicoccus phenolivorans TaxID=266854 RepID=UPI00041114FF|nr:GtrA family protein [Granulicoccus phenolivorans]
MAAHSTRSFLGKPLSKWLRFTRQIISYGIFGSLGALSDLGVYTLLVHQAHLAPLPSNIISVPVGILVSFTFNSRITFRRSDRTLQRALRFFAVGLTGLALSTGLLAVFTHYLAVPPVWAKAFTLPPVVLLQFLANRYWTFRDLDKGEPDQGAPDGGDAVGEPTEDRPGLSPSGPEAADSADRVEGHPERGQE